MTTSSPVTYAEDIVTSKPARQVLAVGRILLGFYFLWAFIDKIFGLNYATAPEMAVINGGSPAQGFINNAVSGPFAGLIKLFANPVGDVLFMAALLGLGVALLLGVGHKVTLFAGSAFMFTLWLSLFPPTSPGSATNPIIDDHWFLAILIIAVTITRAGDTWGLGKWWASKVGDSWLR